jgi:hypothetical protein
VNEHQRTGTAESFAFLAAEQLFEPRDFSVVIFLLLL